MKIKGSDKKNSIPRSFSTSNRIIRGFSPSKYQVNSSYLSPNTKTKRKTKKLPNLKNNLSMFTPHNSSNLSNTGGTPRKFCLKNSIFNSLTPKFKSKIIKNDIFGRKLANISQISGSIKDSNISCTLGLRSLVKNNYEESETILNHQNKSLVFSSSKVNGNY